MKLVVLKNGNHLKNYGIDFFKQNADPSTLANRIARIWREMCTERDTTAVEGQHPIYQVMIRQDRNVLQGAALMVNIEAFAKTITWFLNAGVPKTEGALALKNIFHRNVLTMDDALEQIATDGKFKPYSLSSTGIFCFHFYEGKEWAQLSTGTIAGAAYHLPFDVQDYSQICKAAAQAPAGSRPMVWINAYLTNAFLQRAKNGTDFTQIQLLVSSFIIIAAFTNPNVSDDLAYQLWDAVYALTDAENPLEFLRGYYNTAEQYLQCRTYRRAL